MKHRRPRTRSRPNPARRSDPRARHLRFEPLEDRRLLAVVTVDTLDDSVNFADGVTSLREAIFATNVVGGADTIEFAASLTSGGPATILLTMGELAITDSLTLSGPGANLLTLQAFDPTPDMKNGDGSRIFNIDGANLLDVSISGLTLTGGDVSGTGVAGTGGAIRSFENLAVTECTISANSASSSGGGIFCQVSGTLTVTDSTISGNSAGGGGGGISGAIVTVIGSTVSGNSAGVVQSGGGIRATRDLTVSHSTISDNSAGSSGGGIGVSSGFKLTVTDSKISGNSAGAAGGVGGGGIFGAGSSMTVINSTISDNSAFGYGGGIRFDAGSLLMTGSTISGNSLNGSYGSGGGLHGSNLTVMNSTIVGNSAGSDGGGIRAFGSTALSHTIVAGNTRGVAAEANDVTGGVSLAFSLLGVDTGATITHNGGNLIGTAAAPIDPLLGPLADNGGPTMTHALLAGSPAINRGDLTAVAGMDGVPGFDQRGTPFGRVAHGRIDVGAFEYQAASDLNLVVDTLADESDGDYSLGDLSLREALLLANTYASVDTIHFAPTLAGGTILLTMGELTITDSASIIGLGAELLTIRAFDPTPDMKNGDGSRVFNIDDGNSLVNLDVSISGLTLTGGDVTGGFSEGGGAILSRENLVVADSTISGSSARGIAGRGGGGGIYSSSNDYSASNTLTVTRSTVSGNSTNFDGGGIQTFQSHLLVTESTVSDNSAGADGGGISHNRGNLTVTNSTISGNRAAGSAGGGGIWHSGSSASTVTVIGSAISGNSADSAGGGISTNAILTVTNSTISGNSAAIVAGGIFSGGFGSSVTVTNSTISDNSTGGGGGGIRKSQGILTVIGSTISGNSAIGNGGGILTFQSSLLATQSTIADNQADSDGNGTGRGGGISGSAVLFHTIVAGNALGDDSRDDVFGTATTTFSLIGDNTGATITDNGGNLIGTAAVPIDPLLGPLADNGGPTMTHTLLAGSPTINRGDLTAVAGMGGVPEFDQRGTPFGRVFHGRIDIGAFEYQAVSDLNLVVDTLADESDGDYSLGDLSLREAILLANTYASTDTIHFAPALAGGSILLTMGELTITDNVSIIGLGADLLTLRAYDPTPDTKNGDGSRIFNITDGNDANLLDVSISGATLTGGDVRGSGGAIFARENLSVTDSVISGNLTFGISSSGFNYSGGGIYSYGNLTVTRTTISGNSARGDGGGIRATGGIIGGNVTVTASTISGNSSNTAGGAISNSFVGGSVTVIGSTLSGNMAIGLQSHGGAIRSSNDNLTVIGSTISANSAQYGGGIWNVGGSVTVAGSMIGGNSAGASGGGIFNSLGDLTVTDSTINGNSAGTLGGGVFSTILSTRMMVTNSTISSNSASTDGGGIRSSGNLTVSGSTISDNTAGGNGGGISKTGSGDLTVIDSTISDNSTTTTGAGGGIFTAGGNVSVTNSTISGNSSATSVGHGSGGGISIGASSGTVTVTGSTINENTTFGSGGGIFQLSSGIVIVTNSTISHNSAGASGGGIRVGNGTVTNSTISGNSAGTDGGGIFKYLGGNLTVISTTIRGNSSVGNGGGVFVLSGSAVLRHTIVAENTRGGAATANDVAGSVALAFSLLGANTGATITDNGGNLIGMAAAPIDPLLGPLADNGGPTFTHALLAGSPAINRGDLTAVAGMGNVPTFDQRGTPFGRVFHGRIDIGAFEYQAVSDLNLVVDTLADESDGDYSLGDLSLREAILLANTYASVDTIHFAPALAGGTILLTMGELAITDSASIIGLGANLLTIDASGNDPTPDSTLDDGNAINDHDGSRIFNIDDGNNLTNIDVSISGLMLTGGDVIGGFQIGGGAVSNKEDLTVRECTIRENSVSTFAGGSNAGGGGIFNRGNLTVTASIISDNSASGDGGAIRTEGSNAFVLVMDSTLSGNSAGVDGGGISNTSGSVMVTNSTISDNSATGSQSRGGGIWSSSPGIVTVTGSTISGNVAGRDGGGIFTIGGVTITNSTISGNSADLDGGGILFVASSGPKSVTGSTISGNVAGRDGGGIAGSSSVTNSTIRGNSAGRDGGGSRSAGTISQSTISDNSAGGSGGGLFGGGTVTNSTVSGNSAVTGGGLFLVGNTTLRHSTIAFNTTTGIGKGIFVNSGSLLVDHSIVAQNTGANGDTNGLLGTTITAQYSLVGNNQGSGLLAAPVGSPDANGNLIGTNSVPINPQLAPLADNGGQTLTHALLPGSPAIDAGDPAASPGVGTVPLFDQRGNNYGRVQNGRIDTGAFEVSERPSADFDGDGFVTGLDFLLWQVGYGIPAPAAEKIDGDADNDLDADASDLDVWELQYGSLTLPITALAASHSESPSVVPGPSESDLVDLAIAASLADRHVATLDDPEAVPALLHLADFASEQISLHELPPGTVRGAAEALSSAAERDDVSAGPTPWEDVCDEVFAAVFA